MQVEITDSRQPWMIKEDGQYKCLQCREYRHCTTRAGEKCRKLGGNTIPKIRRANR